MEGCCDADQNPSTEKKCSSSTSRCSTNATLDSEENNFLASLYSWSHNSTIMVAIINESKAFSNQYKTKQSKQKTINFENKVV